MSRIPFFCAAIVAAVALACSGGGGPPGSAPETFVVTQVSPHDEDSDVGLREDIRIVFSRPVDKNSVTVDSVRVVSATGQVVFGQRQVSDLTPTTISFLPNIEFEAETLHRVIVSTTLLDTSGQALAHAHESRFTTQAAPPPMPGQALVEDRGNALAGGRWFHAATRLQDGRVLVAGGYVATSTTQGLVEILDPATGAFTTQAERLIQARARHVQVLLDDGRVLLVGGETDDIAFTPLLTAEIWDPQTGLPSHAAPMQFPRSAATARKLPDGRVLVTGGMSLDGTTFIFRDDAEIYDPAANSWSLLPGTMGRGRSGHGLWRLSNGDFVLVGGTSAEPSADRLDGSTGLFSPTTTLPVNAHIFGASETLVDGRGIYFGGFGTQAITIFDETFGFVAALNGMLAERAFATAHTLSDGRVVIVGGTDFGASPALLHTTIDMFFPEGLSGRMFRVPNLTLPVPTSHHASVVDAAGDLWILGGLPTVGTASGLRRVTVLRLSQE